MNTAIVVAAGSGSRFGSVKPKQFASLLGKPVIIHTLEQFDASRIIDEIVLVLSETGRSEYESFSSKYPVSKLKTIVTGGATRAASVKNGFDAIDRSAANVVAVHDGARPLVSLDEIERTVRAASDRGAACLVGPVTDTVKEVQDSKIVRTVERANLRRALTPQAFRYAVLQRALSFGKLDEAVTDECYLVERLDDYHEIIAVEGSTRNIKITHAEDILIAEAFLSETRE